MRKGYNYTISESYKAKIYIPYLGITFKGYQEILLLSAIFLSIFSSFFLLNKLFHFSFIFQFVLYLIAGSVVIMAYLFLTDKNKVSETDELRTFYYNQIKRYRMVYTDKGEKVFLNRKQKGRRIYVHKR